MPNSRAVDHSSSDSQLFSVVDRSSMGPVATRDGSVVFLQEIVRQEIGSNRFQRTAQTVWMGDGLRFVLHLYVCNGNHSPIYGCDRTILVSKCNRCSTYDHPPNCSRGYIDVREGVQIESEMTRSQEIVDEDLSAICKDLQQEMVEFSGKKVLIVGGAGFLGYYLVQALVKWNRKRGSLQKIDLIVYDNFIRGVPSWLRSLDSDGHLKCKVHDITNPVPEDTGMVDFIVHAASIASPTFYRKRPIETMDANVQGLRNLLDYSLNLRSRGHEITGFLFFSTSEIYGDPDPSNIPTNEEYRGNVACVGPRACYDESKRFGETLCYNFAREENLPIKTVRPFNNYGPGLKITDRRVIPDFVRDILAGRDITILSDGSPTRTFCYITDAVTGYLKALVRGRVGEVYNIGTSNPEVSIREIAELLVELAGKEIGYQGQAIFGKSSDSNYLVDNPNRRCPDIGKAARELNFVPKMELKEGMRRSLMWYVENQEGEEL